MWNKLPVLILEAGLGVRGLSSIALVKVSPEPFFSHVAIGLVRPRLLRDFP